MSRSMNGKNLCCDAPGCTAHVAAPVALNPAVSKTVSSIPAPVRWLFVQRKGTWQHFCPDHALSPMPSVAKSGSDSSSSFPFRNIVLVADNSAAAYAAVAEATKLFVGTRDISITLLFLACGQCMARREVLPKLSLLEQSPADNYCPGTRKALNKLSELLESRSIPFVLRVQSETSLGTILTNEGNQGNHEIMVVAASLPFGEWGDVALPLPIPVLVLPATGIG